MFVNTYLRMYYRVCPCEFCMCWWVLKIISVRTLRLHCSGTELAQNTVDSLVLLSLWCQCNCVVLCHMSSCVQVHASVSFQSPACPSLPSTWETATVFTLRRDRQGEFYKSINALEECFFVCGP